MTALAYGFNGGGMLGRTPPEAAMSGSGQAVPYPRFICQPVL